jgi:hypothetical protein
MHPSNTATQHAAKHWRYRAKQRSNIAMPASQACMHAPPHPPSHPPAASIPPRQQPGAGVATAGANRCKMPAPLSATRSRHWEGSRKRIFALMCHMYSPSRARCTYQISSRWVRRDSAHFTARAQACHELSAAGRGQDEGWKHNHTTRPPKHPAETHLTAPPVAAATWTVPCSDKCSFQK